MAKGRVSASSRESVPSKIAVRQINQTERLNVMSQKVNVILTPCDLITDIDCSNFTSESKVTSENQRCQSPEKGVNNNCDSTKNGKETHSQKTADPEHNGTADVTGENMLEKDLGSPLSGFTPVSFYGSRSQNTTPRTKLFSPNPRKKLREESEDLMSDSSSGIKRKFKKQSNSTAVKKKRKTSSNVKQSKSSGRRKKSISAVCENGVHDYKSESLVNIDEDGKNEGKTEPCESVINDVKGSRESPDGRTCLPQLNDDPEEGGIDLISNKSSPSFVKSATSDIESVCSEASHCSGPGIMLEGLLLRKNGNEYFFNSVDCSTPKERLTPSSEDSGPVTNGTMISDPPPASQNESLMEKMTVCINHTDDSQSSFSFSMPSPDTSESDFTLKLSDKDTESSSSKSSPEHQASIMRYFKSVPGPKCKTKLIANGGSSSTLPSAENSPESKNRVTPKKKKTGKKQEQMYLDLGQKDFGHVTCPTCGMVYTRAQPDDEAAHIRHHKSFVSGLRFPGWKNECVVKDYHDGRVIMVSPDDHPLHLKKIEEVRKVVDSELGFVADVPYRRSGAKTFLFITTKKVVGCSVAVQIDQGYPVLPSPGESSTPEKQIAAWCCSTTPQSAQCGISRIWVHSQYRRKKVATRLLDCVRMNFIYGCIIPRELVAFSDPTPDGKRLAKSYAGTSQFLVFR
ncbi:uncharacterized protein LOC144646304 isoform X2 [Oculina patagonica]